MTGFRLLNIDDSWVASTMDKWAMERLQGPKQESGLLDGVMTVSHILLFYITEPQCLYLYAACTSESEQQQTSVVLCLAIFPHDTKSVI